GPPIEDGPDTLKILVTSDNHLGYKDGDVVLQDDTFVTFKEILDIAEQNKVDMILLGGDLFDKNQPPKHVRHRLMSLLHEYVIGDRFIDFEIVCGTGSVLSKGKANFEDKNINIKMPIFAIHGNHDDPTGPDTISELDNLAENRLINYFGRTETLDNIVIRPLLIKKGNTGVALHGLGYIRDMRLMQSFEKREVMLGKPRDSDQWFHMFVLHQNRVRNREGYIKESLLHTWLDLIVWGHEHECRIDPEYMGDMDFYITQPGSTVATSLIEAESSPKHVGILRINNKQFSMDKIRLRTVRPLVFDKLALHEDPDLAQNNPLEIKACVQRKVEEMIQEAKEEWRRVNGNLEPPLPLIRLYVELGELMEDKAIDWSRGFETQVANPKHSDLFKTITKRRRVIATASSSSAAAEPTSSTLPVSDNDEPWAQILPNMASRLQSLATIPWEPMELAIKKSVNSAASQSIIDCLGSSERILTERMGRLPLETLDNETLTTDAMRLITEEMRTEFRGSSDPLDWLEQSNNADAAEDNAPDMSTELMDIDNDFPNRVSEEADSSARTGTRQRRSERAPSPVDDKSGILDMSDEEADILRKCLESLSSEDVKKRAGMLLQGFDVITVWKASSSPEKGQYGRLPAVPRRARNQDVNNLWNEIESMCNNNEEQRLESERTLQMKRCHVDISSKVQCMMENIAEETVEVTKKRSTRKRKSIHYHHTESSEEEDHSSDPDYMEKPKRWKTDVKKENQKCAK
ncbi:6511_t:CDS:10, partial [Paraglomus brasilianum]